MLTEDEVALVFRRAAELEAIAPGDRPQLDIATLEQIAVEAGLSPAAVRQAVDELRSGRLPVPAGKRRLAPAIPAEIVVERRLDLPVDTVTRRLDGYLRAQMFRVCRRRGDITIWEASHSVAANVMRGIDLTDRMRLRHVDGLEVQVRAEGSHRRGSSVRIVLDLSGAQRNARGGTVTGAAFGVGGLVALVTGFVVGVPEVGLVLPVTTGIAAGAHFGARSTAGKHVKKAVDAIELVLDELEQRS
jgi:hypothetical protein